MPMIAICVLFALFFLEVEEVDHLFFEGLVPVRLLFCGSGEGRRRLGGLGVRCRLSPFKFPLCSGYLA